MKKLNTSLLVAAGAIALSATTATPALAATAPGTPVTVSVTTNNGGVQVGAGLAGQPLSGASADSNGVCVGISLQTSHCVPVSTG